jgi:hypothetical protein
MMTVSREKRRTARRRKRLTRRSAAARRRTIPALSQTAPVACRAIRSHRRTHGPAGRVLWLRLQAMATQELWLASRRSRAAEEESSGKET